MRSVASRLSPAKSSETFCLAMRGLSVTGTLVSFDSSAAISESGDSLALTVKVFGAALLIRTLQLFAAGLAWDCAAAAGCCPFAACRAAKIGAGVNAAASKKPAEGSARRQLKRLSTIKTQESPNGKAPASTVTGFKKEKPFPAARAEKVKPTNVQSYRASGN